MQEKNLFEYAVIRVVPRVEREEFINVGILLYCAKEKFLECIIFLDEHKLRSLSSDIDLEFLRQNLLALKKICKGEPNSGPIGMLDKASRFRWLSATRSTIIQTSKVHPGFCVDANQMLNKLHQALVL